MSLFNVSIGKKIIGIMIATTIIAVFLTNCQLRPLYGKKPQQMRATIEISNPDTRPDTRIEQLTRNHLVFLNTNKDKGGENYRLELDVISSAQGVLDRGTNNNFTAGRMKVSAHYQLVRLSDGEILRTATHQSTAQYDLPEQEFAKIRALQNAENRAGRELAEIIYADITAIISK